MDKPNGTPGSEVRLYPTVGDWSPPVSGYERVIVPLTALRVEADAMRAALAAVRAGRVSETPDEPVLVRAVEGSEVVVEVADGHHRIAAAVLGSCTHVVADLDDVPDVEPLEAPFFDFSGVC